MSADQLEEIRRLLCGLQGAIRAALLAAREREGKRFAQIAAVTAADTIYHVDRLSEETILAWFEAHGPRGWPVELVAEGLDDSNPRRFDLATELRLTASCSTVTG